MTVDDKSYIGSSCKMLIADASGFITGYSILEIMNSGYLVRGTLCDLSGTVALKPNLAKRLDKADPGQHCDCLAGA